MKRLKKINSNNKGMTLVTVIVVIGFIAALVSILLMTTLVNFKMKTTNTRSVDTFYSAEQVLDEISVGLQRRVSDALSSSYNEIMQQYGELSNDEKKDLLQTKYYERMWDYLEVEDSGHAYYDVNKLEAFLKDTTKWHGDTNSEGGAYGAIVTGVATDGTGAENKYGEMVSYAATGIVLKNIKVYYKDPMGFVSVVQTDIRLAYPEFDFAKTSLMADISDYTFIADGGFEDHASGNLTIDGNIYANDFDTKNKDITVKQGKLLISKYDFSVNSGTLTTEEDVTLWARNLNSKNSTIDFKGKAYIANDLNLTGNSGNTVKLKGEYTGYGNSKEDADNSSAILINGKNCKLDLSKLTSLTVAGHAYLGTSQVASDRLSDETIKNMLNVTGVSANDYKNVYTGESMAVKSDQLLYLVPAAAIGVDNNTRRSMFNKNPLTQTEYNELTEAINHNTENDTNYVYVSDIVDIAEIGTSLSGYVARDSISNKPDFYRHVVRVNDENIGALYYFYMKFESEDAANTYFATYFSQNEESLKKYTDIYLDEVLFPNTNTMPLFLTAGNTLKSNSATTSGFEMVNASEYDAATTLQVSAFETKEKFKALCTKLVGSTTELRGSTPCTLKDNINDDEEDFQKVFENVANDPTEIETYVDEVVEGDFASGSVSKDGPNTIVIEGVSGSDTVKAVVTKASSYTLNDSSVNVVIANGDVLCNVADFKGVILCNGKLKSNNSVAKFTASNELTRACLQLGYEKDGMVHTVASCLADGNDYVYSAMLNSDRAANTSLTGLVTYENWKKE